MQMFAPAMRIEEPIAGAMGEPSEDLRRKVLNLLSHTPVSLDDVARDADTAPALVQALMIELELAGHILRQAGGMLVLT